MKEPGSGGGASVSVVVPLFLLLGLFGPACVAPRTANTPSDGPTRDIIQSDSAVVDISFSPDSRQIVHLGLDGTVHLWDLLRDESLVRRRSTEWQPNCIALARGGHYAVAGGNHVRLRHLTSDTAWELPAAPVGVAFLMFDEPGQHLAVADVSGLVRVLNLASRKEVRRFAPASGEGGWHVQRQGRFGLLYSHTGGKLRLVSCAANGSEVTIDSVRMPGTPVAVADGGSRLAVVEAERRIAILRLPDGDRVKVIENVGFLPQALALSPDGSLLAIARDDQGMELWDAFRGERLDTFPSPIWSERGVAFSPDGCFLAWIETEGEAVRFWTPFRGVVRWTQDGTSIRPEARNVCKNHAELVRFRLAGTPFQEGLAQLASRELEAALATFARVTAILPDYPGLALAREEAEERFAAAALHAQRKQTEANGNYRAALEMLEKFLRERAKFDDYGFKKRAAELRAVLSHLEQAQSHRNGDREVEAILAIRAATAIEPDVMLKHPEYGALERDLVQRLGAAASEAFERAEHGRVIEIYTEMTHLRPLDDKALLRLGKSHEQLRQTVDAERAYLSIPKGATEYEAARSRIARMAQDVGDFAKAREHLEAARMVSPDRVDLEREYARVCERVSDFDSAVAAWAAVGRLEASSPQPFERIAEIEWKRSRWDPAANALLTAIARSDKPRPDLLRRLADVHRRAGQNEKVLRIYLELAKLVASPEALDPQSIAFLGPKPERKIQNWIRELGFVRNRKAWVQREQFLVEQGWVRHDEEWLRPDELRLREIAARYSGVSAAQLRAFPEERYASFVEEQVVTKGMNRREVIHAWGFFQDMNVLTEKKLPADGADQQGQGARPPAPGGGGPAPDAAAVTVYEQLTFDRARVVFLKDGLVCFWTE